MLDNLWYDGNTIFCRISKKAFLMYQKEKVFVRFKLKKPDQRKISFDPDGATKILKFFLLVGDEKHQC